ncbi:hypothetical protein RI367_005255 [Sorochytrium milnesiophthora]
MLPWNYCPAVLAALIIAQLAAVALLAVNVLAQRRHRRCLSAVQLVAATMHMLNQSTFLAQHLGRNLSWCSQLVALGTTCFECVLVGALSVLICRSTCLVPTESRRRRVRSGMCALVVGAVVTTALSNVSGNENLDLRDDGLCVFDFDRAWNLVGKACLVVVYVWILVIFLVPLYRHMRTSRSLLLLGRQRQEYRPPVATHSHPSQTDSQCGRPISNITNNPSATTVALAMASSHDVSKPDPTPPPPDRLQAVVRALFIKIALAICTLVLTCTLSATGVLGSYDFIAFSLQNTAMVYASTLSLESFAGGLSGTNTSNHSASRHPPAAGQHRQQQQQPQLPRVRRSSVGSLDLSVRGNSAVNASDSV